MGNLARAERWTNDNQLLVRQSLPELDCCGCSWPSASTYLRWILERHSALSARESSDSFARGPDVEALLKKLDDYSPLGSWSRGEQWFLWEFELLQRPASVDQLSGERGHHYHVCEQQETCRLPCLGNRIADYRLQFIFSKYWQSMESVQRDVECLRIMRDLEIVRHWGRFLCCEVKERDYSKPEEGISKDVWRGAHSQESNGSFTARRTTTNRWRWKA